MQFEFATAARLVFGEGTIREVGSWARALGARPLVVTGHASDRAQPLLSALEKQGMSWSLFRLAGEPQMDDVTDGVQCARRASCDLIIGMGGGSALDAAKAIAALLTNQGDLLDYLEVIGPGKPLRLPPAPVIAIPTTAGTGAEVTRNAVLASPAHRIKVSLRHAGMLPRLALVDPELTYPLPPAITAATGMDALTQLIEPFVSVRANPVTDSFCVEGLRRITSGLRRAFAHGSDTVARRDMALASLLGGLALANAGLGAVHGFAAPVGGMFPAPHGAVCARLLAPVMETNVRALRRRPPASDALNRYTEIARLLTGNSTAGPDDGVAWVRRLCLDLGIPGLGAYGLTRAAMPDLVEKAAQASSMKANPLVLTRDELLEILDQSI